MKKHLSNKQSWKAWAGFTDGKMYLRYDKEHDEQEYCIYKTKWRAKMDFEDVRPVRITPITKRKKKS